MFAISLVSDDYILIKQRNPAANSDETNKNWTKKKQNPVANSDETNINWTKKKVPFLN